MISVKEARERILAGIHPVGLEQVSVAQAAGRVLGAAVAARVTHPPAAVSAMDGYAVRAADVAAVPAVLTVTGESAAGRGFEGAVGTGQAIRIFTGAPIPEGADAIAIQENTERDGERVTIKEPAPAGRFIRPAGMDFAAGDALLQAGRILTPRDIGLVAAMNVPWLSVRRRPRIAILSTGDEIVMPGEPLTANQIIGSNGLALAAFVAMAGGEPILLGTALDNAESLKATAAGARGADLLVTSGGASVGDYDLVQSALGETGLELDFYKVAMRPGKPLMFGRLGDVPLLGFPGNPVSALVCAEVFLRPAMRAMVGLEPEERRARAILGGDLPANDMRQDHLRAALSRDDAGNLVATAFEAQDSAMMAALARADCLVIRPADAPPAKAGEPVEIIPLRD